MVLEASTEATAFVDNENLEPIRRRQRAAGPLRERGMRLDLPTNKPTDSRAAAVAAKGPRRLLREGFGGDCLRAQ